MLAIEMLYAIMTSTLAVYNILPPKDEQGNPIKMEAHLTGGALMCVADVLGGFDSAIDCQNRKPEPFDCIFEPRSSVAKGLLQHMKDGQNL